MPFLLQT